MGKRDDEYRLMYNTYLKYEDEYLRWAMLRKQFNQDILVRKYYRKNGAKTRRKFAELVVADYSELELSGWDIYKQVGGCKETIFDYDLAKWKNDSYIHVPGTVYGWYIYEKLRDNPDQIYEAIEETYDWSCKIDIRTTVLADAIPKVIEFIATECIKKGDVND